MGQVVGPLMVALAIVGCTGPLEPSANAPSLPPSYYGAGGGGVHFGAGLSGVLRGTVGCLWIENEPGSSSPSNGVAGPTSLDGPPPVDEPTEMRTLVVFSDQFRVEGNPAAVVHVPTGHIVAQVGDHVELGGGFGQPPDEACTGTSSAFAASTIQK